MADNNINVLDMVNKSRNEVAYNILDLGEMPENAVLEALENIDAIMAIRVI
jgi:D-3-phosphoglycerate dehydrogenase